jgi:hypothetical protein
MKKNGITIGLPVGPIAKLPGAEDPAAVLIHESYYHAGVCLVKVIVEECSDSFSLGVGERVLCRGWKLSGKPKPNDNEEYVVTMRFHRMWALDISLETTQARVAWAWRNS